MQSRTLFHCCLLLCALSTVHAEQDSTQYMKTANNAFQHDLIRRGQGIRYAYGQCTIEVMITKLKSRIIKKNVASRKLLHAKNEHRELLVANCYSKYDFLDNTPCLVFVKPSTHSMYSVSLVTAFFTNLGVRCKLGGVLVFLIPRTPFFHRISCCFVELLPLAHLSKLNCFSIQYLPALRKCFVLYDPEPTVLKGMSKAPNIVRRESGSQCSSAKKFWSTSAADTFPADMSISFCSCHVVNRVLIFLTFGVSVLVLVLQPLQFANCSGSISGGAGWGRGNGRV